MSPSRDLTKERPLAVKAPLTEGKIILVSARRDQFVDSHSQEDCICHSEVIMFLYVCAVNRGWFNC